MRIRSFKDIRLLSTSVINVAIVTKPSPPNWNNMSNTTCPKVVSWVPVSMTARPVTQVAEVAINKASIKDIFPDVEEMGRLSRNVPAVISIMNPKDKTLGGVILNPPKFRLANVILLTYVILE